MTPRDVQYYSLGYAVADGCLTESPSGTPRLMWLSTDKQIIDDLAKRLPVKPPTCQIPNNLREKPVWRIARADREFVGWYLERGLVRRKTYNQGPLEIPMEMRGVFLRGYFDGDGYIGNRGGHSPGVAISFCSWSVELLEWIQSWTKGLHIYKSEVRARRWYSLAGTGANAFPTLKMIYGDDLDLRLERKWLRYKEYVSQGIVR